MTWGTIRNTTPDSANLSPAYRAVIMMRAGNSRLVPGIYPLGCSGKRLKHGGTEDTETEEGKLNSL